MRLSWMVLLSLGGLWTILPRSSGFGSDSGYGSGFGSGYGTDCYDGAVRLVGGSNFYSGRVEICYFGEWGTVCDDDWDDRDAIVVCRQLGFSDRGALVFRRAFFGGGLGSIFLDQVDCSGFESMLTQCPANPIGIHDCSHSEDAGVQCALTDCYDGAVRLVGGSDSYSGRVEICYFGEWGTVCDDDWDDRDAIVVCRQLGFSDSGAFVFCGAFFGGGFGSIFLDQVDCSGFESMLTQCPANPIGIHDCVHEEDAGVQCGQTVISTTSGTESTDTLARSSLTGIAEGAAAVGTILILTIIAAVIAGYFIVRRRRSHRVPGVIDLQDKQVYGIENIMLPEDNGTTRSETVTRREDMKLTTVAMEDNLAYGTTCMETSTRQKDMELTNVKMEDNLAYGTTRMETSTRQKDMELTNVKMEDNLAYGTTRMETSTRQKDMELTNVKMEDNLAYGTTRMETSTRQKEMELTNVKMEDNLAYGTTRMETSKRQDDDLTNVKMEDNLAYWTTRMETSTRQKDMELTNVKMEDNLAYGTTRMETSKRQDDDLTNVKMEDNLAYGTTHMETSTRHTTSQHDMELTHNQAYTTTGITVDSNKCYGITSIPSVDPDQLYAAVEGEHTQLPDMQDNYNYISYY